MKRELLLFTALAWGTSAVAADSGHCDSKPFTLKKATVAAPAKPPPPPSAAAPPPKPKPSTKAKTAQAGKSKYPIGCKQPKS